MDIRVAALDVAFANTGYAILEYNRSKDQWDLAAHGIIKTKKESKKRKIYAADDMVRRIRDICTELDELRNQWEFKLVVAELPSQGGKSSNAVASMAIGSAVIASFTFFRDLSYNFVTPNDVKVAMTGDKQASKEAMENAAVKLYPELIKVYKSNKATSGWAGEFEHVADAIGAFMASKSSPMIKLLEGV